MPVRRGAIVQRIDAPRHASRRSARARSAPRCRAASSASSSTRATASRRARRSSRSTASPTRWRSARRRRRSITRAPSSARSRPTSRAPASSRSRTSSPAQQIEKLETARRGGALERAAGRPRRVALAQHKLERTLVRAPYAASVVARLADEGTTALVQPQTIVVVLQESGELEARATIPESRLSLVRVGDPALIHVEGLAAPIQTEVAAVARRDRPGDAHLPRPDARAEPRPRAQGRRLRAVEILPQSKRDALRRAARGGPLRGRPHARLRRARRRRRRRCR